MSKIFAYGWAAILSALGLYELYALLWGHGKDWPLTWVTVKYVKWYYSMPFLTWLWVHFAIRYGKGKAYLAGLGK